MRERKFFLWSATCILILVFSVAKTVFGMQADDYGLNNPYYKQMEEKYLEEVKAELADWGMENSGLSLTKVIVPNGEREYTLTLHHHKMNRMNEREREEVISRLEKTENTTERFWVTIKTIP